MAATTGSCAPPTSRARDLRTAVLGQLSAGVVASAVHPATTFLVLVGGEHIADGLAEDIRNFRTRSPSAKVNLALLRGWG